MPKTVCFLVVICDVTVASIDCFLGGLAVGRGTLFLTHRLINVMLLLMFICQWACKAIYWKRTFSVRIFPPLPFTKEKIVTFFFCKSRISLVKHSIAKDACFCELVSIQFMQHNLYYVKYEYSSFFSILTKSLAIVS